MDELEAMFREVQVLARSGLSGEQAMRRIVAFARANAPLFDAEGLWEWAEGHEFTPALEAAAEWAREGMESLGPGAGWELLLLDLGDCPELFRLYAPGSQGLMSERRLREALANEVLIGCQDLYGCFGAGSGDPYRLLFGDTQTELSGHHVSELEEELLGREAVDFDGYGGMLLWLAVGSLGLVAPLADPGYCADVLQGRERLYLLSGFESAFFYAGTVTPGGIRHEWPSPSAV